MTDQRADYPDDLRVSSTVLPVPFIGGAGAQVAGFPYSLSSGALQGPFNVAPWPSTQLFFQPSAVDQRVALNWYDDSAGSHQIGAFNFNVQVSLPFAYVVRNMGPYLGVQVISAGGGTLGGSLWVGGSTRTLPGVAYQTSSFVCDLALQSIPAGGHITQPATYAYMGPSLLNAQGSVNKWGVRVIATDILGNNRDVYSMRTAAHDVNAGIFLPALKINLRIDNFSTSQGSFLGVLTQSQLP